MSEGSHQQNRNILLFTGKSERIQDYKISVVRINYHLANQGNCDFRSLSFSRKIPGINCGKLYQQQGLNRFPGEFRMLRICKKLPFRAGIR